MDVRTTENKKVNPLKGIRYGKPNTINLIFIGNRIDPRCLPKKIDPFMVKKKKDLNFY